MYVCMYVCLSEHAILAVRAIRSITKDAIVLSVRFAAILKRRFSLNCLIRKLERLLKPVHTGYRMRIRCAFNAHWLRPH